MLRLYLFSNKIYLLNLDFDDCINVDTINKFYGKIKIHLHNIF